MSHVLCPHECGCSCHRRVVPKRWPGPEFSPIHIFEPALPPDHGNIPCCDGQCAVLGCGKFINRGMMTQHLMGCHQMSESEAEALIQPYTLKE